MKKTYVKATAAKREVLTSVTALEKKPMSINYVD